MKNVSCFIANQSCKFNSFLLMIAFIFCSIPVMANNLTSTCKIVNLCPESWKGASCSWDDSNSHPIASTVFNSPAECGLETQPSISKKSSSLSADLESLNGSIIVIKSLRWDGAYIDANHTGGARVTSCPRSKLVDAIWSKLIVHHVSGNVVCFESVRFPDHYLDMGHDNILRFTFQNDIPKRQDWALFSIHGNNFKDVGIRSERWNKDRWLDAHHTGNLYGAWYSSNTRPTDKWGRFEMRFPGQIKEDFHIITLQNNSSQEVERSYTYSVGMSRTDSKSIENSIELSTEIKKNFGTPVFSSGDVTFGAKYSTKWVNQESQTYSLKEETTDKIPIAPFTTVHIKQLRATYGPIIVRSTYTEIDEVPMKSN